MIIAASRRTTCARLHHSVLLHRLTDTASVRATSGLSRLAFKPAKMPPKTASQQVSAYDNEPSRMGAFHHEKTDAAENLSSPSTLVVKEVVGDIFDAPPNAVIVHACNCIGDWGAGIAAAFKKHYPSAFKLHQEFCKNSPEGTAKIATAQLIPPVDSEERRHYVGCVFTSVHYGRKRDSPTAILENTGPAMVDLLRKIVEVNKTSDVGEVRMCKINSGLFGVPWEKTLEVLQNIKLEPGMPSTVTVFERA